MSVNIIVPQHPPPPEAMDAHLPSTEQPVATPPTSDEEPSDDNGDNQERRRGGRHHGGPHRHSRGHRGFSPKMGGGRHCHHGFKHHPLFDGEFPPEFGPRGGHGGKFGHRGGPGMFGPHGGPRPHGHPHQGFHGQHRGGRGKHGHPAFGPLGFDFLQRFASEMGNGFEDLFTTDRNQIDFIPRADVFDTTTEYVVHVSLPGAQKSDVSIEYDAQIYALRLAGVIHRPEFNEELNNAMIHDERSREVGVFERIVKLGNRHRRAVNVDQEKISAKLVDGVLVVRLPKTEDQTQGSQNKKVVINEDIDIEGAAPLEDEKNEKLVEVEDGLHSMQIHSETEASDLPRERSYTPSHVSDEDAGEYVKIDTQ